MDDSLATRMQSFLVEGGIDVQDVQIIANSDGTHTALIFLETQSLESLFGEIGGILGTVHGAIIGPTQADIDTLIIIVSQYNIPLFKITINTSDSLAWANKKISDEEFFLKWRTEILNSEGKDSGIDCLYIGNRNSKKFHYPWCRYVDRMKEENKVCFHSREEAIAAGYIPCKVCNP